ncbi:SDR family oxidoreductase [Paenibacillus sp. IB182496]|uniref:SDR family oxidoreductase n=1 Tax=Paenibacillus sabuli TaxID=2772509 RepID=A0A927BXW6_9BACL|nr:SDR family oxidoreductase [Paenibacillus sabuli]MBD2847760.1 SDR family oxidoreductase [Paenibacillus sabuli]
MLGAIITGAAGGIGHILAESYAAKGYRVMLADKNETGVLEEAGRIAASGVGREVYAEAVDLRDPEAVAAMIAVAGEQLGSVDVLINNAGFGIGKSPYELSWEEWDSVLNTNLRGSFLCAREAAKLMRRQEGGGAIVNIASTRALMSEPHSEAYAASKGGLLALTHALAASLAPDRITVNCVSPGWIETGDYDALRLQDHEQHFSGRVGRPDDIAKACLYLTDPTNDFVTGINLVVDGGMTSKMIYEP